MLVPKFHIQNSDLRNSGFHSRGLQNSDFNSQLFRILILQNSASVFKILVFEIKFKKM